MSVMTKQTIKPTMAVVFFLQGALAAAPFELQGSSLTINSSSLAVTFRGPDLVGVTNRLTEETYLRASAPIRYPIWRSLLRRPRRSRPAPGA